MSSIRCASYRRGGDGNDIRVDFWLHQGNRLSRGQSLSLQDPSSPMTEAQEPVHANTDFDLIAWQEQCLGGRRIHHWPGQNRNRSRCRHSVGPLPSLGIHIGRYLFHKLGRYVVISIHRLWTRDNVQHTEELGRLWHALDHFAVRQRMLRAGASLQRQGHNAAVNDTVVAAGFLLFFPHDWSTRLGASVSLLRGEASKRDRADCGWVGV